MQIPVNEEVVMHFASTIESQAFRNCNHDPVRPDMSGCDRRARAAASWVASGPPGEGVQQISTTSLLRC